MESINDSGGFDQGAFNNEYQMSHTEEYLSRGAFFESLMEGFLVLLKAELPIYSRLEVFMVVDYCLLQLLIIFL